MAVLDRFHYLLSWSQDGVASPEDIDTVLTDGLGLRYSILGPFEAIHLNANGMSCRCTVAGCAPMCMLLALSCSSAVYILLEYSTGIGDYCERYGENISRICEEQGGPRQLNGQALDSLKQRMEQKIPLDQLEERRRLRDKRLAALTRHRCSEEKNV